MAFSWLNTYKWPEVEYLVFARHEGSLHPELAFSPERSRRGSRRVNGMYFLDSMVFPFFLLPFSLPFRPEDEKKAPPIIGATCGFDAKIYKIVDSFFSVSPCLTRDKNFFQISDFCFQLQADLVDLLDKILPILTPKT